MTLSIQEFSAKIKSKYPEYKNVDDSILAQKIVSKYPEYKNKVDLGSSSISPSQESPSQAPDYFGKGVVDFIGKVGSEFAGGAIQQAPKTATNLGGTAFDALAQIPGSPLGIVNDFQKRISAAPEMAKTGQFVPGKGVSEVISGAGEQAKNFLKEQIQKAGVNTDSFAGGAGEFATDLAGSLAARKVMPTTGNKYVDSLANTASVTAASEGKMPNPIEAATGYGFDALFGAIAKRFTKSGANEVKNLMKKGLKEQDAYLINNLDDEGKKVAEEYLVNGVKKLKDRNKSGVFQKAAEEVDDFFSIAKDKIDELGVDVGRLKPELKGKMAQTSSLTSQLDDLAKNYNVTLDQGGNVKAWGDLEGATGASQMYAKIKQVSNSPKADARALESLTSEIDRKIGIYQNKGLKLGDPAIKALVDMKTALNSAIGTASPEFAAANEAFAKAKSLLSTLESAGNVKVGKDYIFNGEQILRRSQGNAGVKPTEAINTIEELAKSLGIDSPKNLQIKANLAELAERITGTKAPTSLGGITESVGENLKSKAASEGMKKVPVVGPIIDAASTALGQNSPKIEAQTQKIIKMLKTKSPSKIIDDNTISEIKNAVSVLSKLGLFSGFSGK